MRSRGQNAVMIAFACMLCYATLAMAGEIRNISRRIEFVQGLAVAEYANGAATTATSPAIVGLYVDAVSGLVYFLNDYAVRLYNPHSNSVSTFAGGLPNAVGDGVRGAVDGFRLSARFRTLNGIAFASSVNSLVLSENTYVRLLSLTTGWVVHLAGQPTLSGTTTNGNGTAARFGLISGIAVGFVEDVFAVDRSARCIRRITLTGATTTFAGTCGAAPLSTDGVVGVGRFETPRGIAFHAPTSQLFVIDDTAAIVRRIDATGFVATIAGQPSIRSNLDANVGTAARFLVPTAISTGPDGFYISQQFSVRRVSFHSPYAVTTFCGPANQTLSGYRLGACATVARFNNPPLALHWNGTTNLVLADDTQVLTSITASTMSLSRIALYQFVVGADKIRTSSSMMVLNGTLYIADDEAACIKW